MDKVKLTGVWKIIKIALAFLLIGVVFSKIKFEDLISLGRRISPSWLVVSLVMFIFVTMGKALQYYALINPKVTYPRMLNIVIWQNVVSNLFAASAGIASYITMLRVEQGVKISRSTSVFLITKIGDLFFTALSLGLSGILLWSSIRNLQSLIIALLLVISFILILFWATVVFRKRFMVLIEKILNFLGLVRVPFVKKALEMLKAISEYQGESIFRMFVLATGLSFLYFVLTLGLMYANVRMFEIPISIWPIILISTLIQLLSLIPISVFGGLGVSDISFMYLFNIFGIPQAESAVLVLGFRVLSYLLNGLSLVYLPIFNFFDHKEQGISA